MLLADHLFIPLYTDDTPDNVVKYEQINTWLHQTRYVVERLTSAFLW